MVLVVGGWPAVVEADGGPVVLVGEGRAVLFVVALVLKLGTLCSNTRVL